MTVITKGMIVAFFGLILIAVLAASYQMGFDAGIASVKTTPIVTQAQRIKALETTVEMLVNNEQISAETALKLDAIEGEFNTHVEESAVDTSTEGTTTP